jgi:hypothetical protein
LPADFGRVKRQLGQAIKRVVRIEAILIRGDKLGLNRIVQAVEYGQLRGR